MAQCFSNLNSTKIESNIAVRRGDKEGWRKGKTGCHFGHKT